MYSSIEFYAKMFKMKEGILFLKSCILTRCSIFKKGLLRHFYILQLCLNLRRTSHKFLNNVVFIEIFVSGSLIGKKFSVFDFFNFPPNHAKLINPFGSNRRKYLKKKSFYDVSVIFFNQLDLDFLQYFRN